VNSTLNYRQSLAALRYSEFGRFLCIDLNERNRKLQVLVVASMNKLTRGERLFANAYDKGNLFSCGNPAGTS